MAIACKHRSDRAGGVYIAVLGTSLIVALLGISTLMAQRIQNRMLNASADITQARLNAHAAVELALLTMKQNNNWRSSQPHGNWFTNRGTGAGTCSLNVTDPLDANLADNADEPVVIRGVGLRGLAEQHFEIAVDPHDEPLGCLRSAVAASDIDLQSDTLRTDGLISANTSSASSSQVYGNVEAVSVSGSTYHGSTTTILAAKRPAMPDWSSVFSYYRTNGTQINIANLPTSTPNLGRNISFDVDTSFWTGTAAGLPNAVITRETGINGHTASLRVQNRAAITAGASQSIDHFVKGGQSYTISLQVYVSSSWGNAFKLKLCTQGVGAAAQTNASSVAIVESGNWENINVTVTAPSWSGELESARLTIDTDHGWGTSDSFFIDNLDIRETTTGRFIYRQVLSPSINPFGVSTNSQGIYWIDCSGNQLVIERSRVLGTLLVINPGAGSRIADGPIVMSPAVAGYPALLVDANTASDADFAIYATNRALNEKNNGVNFNPAGAPHEEFGQDGDTSDIYQSGIFGLVAVEDDLTFQNRPFIRGQLILGDDLSTSSGTLEVEYRPTSLLNPPPGFSAPNSYVRRPTSGRKAVLP